MKSGLFVSLLKYRRVAYKSLPSTRVRHISRNVQRVVLAAAALACGETPTAPPLSVPTPLPTQIVEGVRCSADMHTRQISCGTGTEGSATASRSRSGAGGINADLIVGGQNMFVKLTTSSISYSGDVFSFTTTVQNLIPQALGTTDGVTLDSAGVKVFFELEPYATGGTGTIDFVDPAGGGSLVDGFAGFTRANQPYYKYNQIIAPNQTSAGKAWRIHIPSSVTTFAFTVYVSAPVQYPTGWVDVTPPAATLQAGQTQQLSAVVRDAVGRVQTGAPVTWSSAPTSVATVDPSTGLVTAVADGVATVTAASTTRTGRSIITVATPTVLNIDAGDGQTALVGAAVGTSPSVILLDQNGAPVPNVQVTFSVTGGGGSASALVATTNASGIATVGTWTLGAGGAGCSATAITNCSRNTLHAVAAGGSSPAVDIKGYIPPIVPAAALYQAVGNATLPIAANIGLLQDAFSINGNGANGQGATLTVTTPTPTGSNGGTVTIAGDGSFSYLSSPTYVSAGGTFENFTYTVTDGIAALTSNGTLQVNVPEHVWYVQPGFGGTSTGSDVQPFKDFSGTSGQGVEFSASASDTILVFTGTGSAAGGTLKDGQYVYGQGAPAAKTFPTGSAATYRNGGQTITLLAAPVGSPQVGALTIGVGNTLLGITLVGNGATALTGLNFGSLTVGDVIVNSGAQQALSLNTGTLIGSFTSITSAGGANNILLNTVGTSGSFALGNGALSAATTDGLRILNGGGTFTYSGTIANATSLAANVSNMSGGGLTLSGNINSLASPGRGVAFTSNTGGSFTLSGSEIGISGGATTGVNITGNSAAVNISFTPGTAMQIATTSATGFNATGNGTLTVAAAANTINSTGALALNVNGVVIGASGLNFSSVTSGGGTNNVTLTSVGGTGPIVLSGGALSGATGTSFALSGGTNAVTYNGTITKTAAGQLVTVATRVGSATFGGNLSCTGTCGSASGAISVANVSGGTIAFSGATKTITTTTAGHVGVSLNANTGSFIDFTNGGLAVQTASGNAFNATGGGTVTVQVGANPNTLTSTTGTALNVTSTNIGASGLTFRSISANGGSNGIFLSSTGATGGGLNVTGAGSAGSGGTIQNTTGADAATAGNGIYLSSTRNVKLSWMAVTAHQNNGLFGTAVRGLDLDHVRFTGNNGTSNSGTLEESPVHLVDAGGGITVKNSRLDGGAWNGFLLRNTSGTAPTIDSLVLAFDTVSVMQGSTADVRNTGLQAIIADGTGTIRMRDNSVTFWWANGIQVTVQTGAGAVTAVIQNNKVQQTSGALAGAGGIEVNGGNLAFNISGNTITGADGSAISADKNQGNTFFNGTINNNTIGTSGVANSGSATGTGIFVQHAGPNATTVNVTNNTIRQINSTQAIWMLLGDDAGGGGAGTLNTTITGNIIAEEGTAVSTRTGIIVQSGRVTGDTDQLCADIGGAGSLANSITNFNNRIRPNERFLTTMRLRGYTGANNDNAAVNAYLTARNPGTVNLTANNVGAGGPGILNTTPAGSACPQPTL